MAVTTTQQAILSGLAIGAAVLYSIVAWTQSRRPVSARARGARNGFVLWWAGLAVIATVGVVLEWGPGLGTYGLNGVRAILYILFALIFVMLAGLIHYLLFLYTGRPKAIYWTAAFYAFMFLFLVWFIEGHAPYVGPDADTGEQGLQFADEPSAVLSATFSVLLLVPPLAAATAYFLLFFRTGDRTARYRILMVSGGFVLWFAYSLIGSLANAVARSEGQGFLQQLGGQLVGVFAAVLVLLAYHPPRLLRKRFGLRTVEGSDSVEERELVERPPRVAVV